MNKVPTGTARRLRVGVATLIATGGLLAAGIGQASLAVASCGDPSAVPACDAEGGVSPDVVKAKAAYDKAESKYHTLRGVLESKGDSASPRDHQALFFAAFKLERAEDALFEASKAGKVITKDELARAVRRKEDIESFVQEYNDQKTALEESAAALDVQYVHAMQLLKVKGDAASQDERDAAKAAESKYRDAIEAVKTAEGLYNDDLPDEAVPTEAKPASEPTGSTPTSTPARNPD